MLLEMIILFTYVAKLLLMMKKYKICKSGYVTYYLLHENCDTAHFFFFLRMNCDYVNKVGKSANVHDYNIMSRKLGPPLVGLTPTCRSSSSITIRGTQICFALCRFAICIDVPLLHFVTYYLKSLQLDWKNSTVSSLYKVIIQHVSYLA